MLRVSNSQSQGLTIIPLILSLDRLNNPWRETHTYSYAGYIIHTLLRKRHRFSYRKRTLSEPKKTTTTNKNHQTENQCVEP